MRQMSLGVKLITFFLLVGLIPFGIIATISFMKSSKALSEAAYNQLSGMRAVKNVQITQFFAERQEDMGVLVETVDTLRKEAFGKLTAIREIKKNQIENFFQGRMSDVRVLADNASTLKAFKSLKMVFDIEGGALSGKFKGSLNGKYSAPASYKGMHDIYFPNFRFYIDEYGFYNLFLIDAETGDTLFSVTKEPDFGTSIHDVDSGLHDVWALAVKGQVALSDTKPYAPSNGIPAQFIAAPIKDDEEIIGVVVLQISLDDVNRVMMERTGLGETGETYLVGPDQLMRSDSFLYPENHTVKASFADPDRGSVNTEASKAAVAGETGANVIIGYNKNPVLSSYTPVKIGDLTWGVLAEIDVAEAFCPKDESGEYYFKKYTQMYGYYDLFLINPDGYCFYSVTQGAEYQTNFENGKFLDSGLSKLFRKVKTSKAYDLTDIAPYAPGNNEPAAFIAQPVIHNDKVETVVALQLSLEAINTIMQQREGMGKSGETYLVGSDKLMRSDPFLDPENHSVKASFANPSSGMVDTDATREALGGKKGHKTIIDHNGKTVLSSFVPLKIGGTVWALIAEIEESEAFSAVNVIKWLILIMSIIAVAAIVVVAVLISQSISNPINIITAGMSDGANQVASAAGQVSSASQSLAEGSSQQAASIEETSSSMEEMSSMIKKNAESSSQADHLMKEANQVVKSANKSMGQLTVAMEDISKASEETSKIIKTIDEIAFQTNLLALNAAVEAARAGEAGAGFAVVAEEVRNLAMRAAEAAKDTEQLIESTMKKVADGSNIVASTNEAFTKVAGSSYKVGELVAEISDASSEQSNGINQVNIAIAEMDKVVQQNAANAEESASAADEMSAQSEQLREYVLRLLALVTGKRGNQTAGNQTDLSNTKPAKRGKLLPAKTT